MAPPPPRLAYLPVSLFGSVMGIAGLGLAWQRAHDAFGVPRAIGVIIAWAGATVFAVLTMTYLAKARRHWDAVRAEWTDPVRMAFAPTTAISLMVLAPALQSDVPRLAEAMWWVGAVSQVVLTLMIVRSWILNPAVRLQHVHPGWFIPVVGPIVAPVAGVSFAPLALNWALFAVGIAYWLAVWPLVMTRLVTGDPLPPRLVPTFAVLISPPAVGSIAWVRLGGHWGDQVSSLLLGLAAFQGLLLATQFSTLRRSPFAPSAWAYTFPLAALSAAMVGAYAATGYGPLKWPAVATLVVISIVVVGVAVRTTLALKRGELLRADPAVAGS